MSNYLKNPITLIVTVVLTEAKLWLINPPSLTPDGTDKFAHLVAFPAIASPMASTARIELVATFVGASGYSGFIAGRLPPFTRSGDTSKQWPFTTTTHRLDGRSTV